MKAALLFTCAIPCALKPRCERAATFENVYSQRFQDARIHQSNLNVKLLSGEALIKEPPGNALVFRLARRALFLKQEWTLPSSAASKKEKQRRQTE
ncbi:hypothetical protein [Desulfovibrio sp.]|uniref:hypothetical protein n=1 Tax=Desulfovibrio sp. TaxID=885 RepID=UPI003D130D02